MEYDIAKKMGDFKLAASILADNYSSRNCRWDDEVSSIFMGIQSTPINHQSQSEFCFVFQTISLELFLALPHRVQLDMFISYCSSAFDTVEAKTNFILQFLTNRLDMLGEGSFVGALLENLVDLLVIAEENHCQALNKKSENIPSTPQSPDMKDTAAHPSGSHTLNESTEDVEIDEGEEGEVLEEADDDDEEIDDDDDAEAQNSKLLSEKQWISVLNVHRMRLACEVLPMVHRVSFTRHLLIIVLLDA